MNNNIAPSTPEFATLAEVSTPASTRYREEKEQIHINRSVENSIMSDDELPLPFTVENETSTESQGSEETPENEDTTVIPEQFTDETYTKQLKQYKELMASPELERQRLQKEKDTKLTQLFNPQGNTSLVGMAISSVWDSLFSKIEEEHFVQNPEDRRGYLERLGEDASAGFFGQDLHPERGDRTSDRLSFLFKPFEVLTAAVFAPFSEKSAKVQENQQRAKALILESSRTGVPISPEIAQELNATPEDLQEATKHPIIAAMDALDLSKQAVIQKVTSDYGDPSIDFGQAVMEEQVPNAPAPVKTAGAVVLNILTDPTTVAGAFTAKAAQLGLKRAQNIDPSATYKGLMQEGVTQIADDIKRLTSVDIDKTKLSDLGDLAARADTGDVEALSKLNVELSKIPEISNHVKKIDDEVIQARNLEIDQVLGNPNSKSFDIKDTDKGIELDLNLSSFNDDSDLDELVKAFSDRAEKDIAKFGVKSEEKFIEFSEAAATDIQNILGKPVKDFTPSETIAYRQALQTTASHLGKLAKRADAPNATPLEQIAYEKTLGIFTALANKATDAKNQQAVLKDIYKVGEKGGVKRVREVLSLVEESKGVGHTDAAIRKALAEQNDPELLAKTAASASRLSKLPGAYMEALTNATISSLDTQATNIKSNLGTALMMPIQTFTQSLSAVARADLRMAQTHAQDGLAQLAGLSEGLSDILKMSFTKSNWDSQGLPNELKKTSELARQEIKHKISSENLDLQGPLGILTDVTGKYVRVPGAALLVADRGFKTLNYRMQIHSTAMKIGRDAAKTNNEDALQIYNTLKNNPTDDMLVQAIDVAEQNTFTQSLGNGRAGDVQKFLAKTPVAQPFFMFFKTTTNILKRGLQDSAPGVLKQHAQNILENSARGDVARARITLGLALPTALVASMDNTDIVGRLDYNDPHDRFMLDMGVPEYSIKTGEDEKGNPTYFEYGKFEPLRAILGLAANYKHAANMYRAVDPETGQENPVAEELFKAVASPFVHTYTDNYMIENVGGVLNILDAVNTGKEETLVKELERLTGSVVFNNFMSNINNTYIDGTFRYADDYVSRIKNRIAVLSQQNSAQVTAWGDSRIRPRNVGIDYLSSTVSLGQSFDKFDEEIINKGVMLEEPPKTIDAGDGIILKLSGPLRTEYGILRGKGIPGQDPKALGGELKPQMIDIMLSDDYLAKATDREKRQLLQDMWTARGAAVKSYMMQNNEELKQQYEEKLLLLEMQNIKSRNNPTPFGERP